MHLLVAFLVVLIDVRKICMKGKFVKWKLLKIPVVSLCLRQHFVVRNFLFAFFSSYETTAYWKLLHKAWTVIETIAASRSGCFNLRESCFCSHELWYFNGPRINRIAMVKKKIPRPFATRTQEFLFRKVTCKDVVRN